MPLKVALYRPEIPPNTGNIMRLCANTGTELHLIHPLGFSLDERRLRRAGMDYREFADVTEHPDFDSFVREVAPERLFAFTRNAERQYSAVEYRPGDVLLYGPESEGLPVQVLERGEVTERLRIPMVPHTRSLNLSNSVAITLYEAARQLGFPFEAEA